MRKLPLSSYPVTIVLLACAAGVVTLAERRVPMDLARPLASIDAEILGWSAVKDMELTAATVRALDPTSYLSRMYRKGSQDLDVFVAYYAQQRAGESMHSPKHCLPGAGWEIWKHGSASVRMDGTDVRINKYSIQNDNRRLLMFYWYQSADNVIASEYTGKLLLARDTLLTGRTAASIVRIALPDVPGAEAEGTAFAAQLIAQTRRCFGRQ